MYISGLGQEPAIVAVYDEEATAEANELERQADILAWKITFGVGAVAGLVGGVIGAGVKKGMWAGAIGGFVGAALGVGFIRAISR